MVCYFVTYVPEYMSILPDLLQVVKFRVFAEVEKRERIDKKELTGTLP